jgi:hypothetical protein
MLPAMSINKTEPLLTMYFDALSMKSARPAILFNVCIPGIDRRLYCWWQSALLASVAVFKQLQLPFTSCKAFASAL